MEGPDPQTVKEHSPRRGNHSIARVLHVTLGLISILLAVRFGLILWMEVAGDTPDLVATAVSFAVAAFFGSVGFRLISGRGVKTGGGLFSPMGYRFLGVVLALLAMLFFFVLVSGAGGTHVTFVAAVIAAVIALVFFGIPSVLCFVAAHRRAKVISR